MDMLDQYRQVFILNSLGSQAKINPKNPIRELPKNAAFWPVGEKPPFVPGGTISFEIINFTLGSRDPNSDAQVSADATHTVEM